MQLSFAEGQFWKILFWEALKKWDDELKVARCPLVVRKQVMWVKGSKMVQNEKMGLDVGIFM